MLMGLSWHTRVTRTFSLIQAHVLTVTGSHTHTHACSRHLASRMHQDRERRLPTRRTWALGRVSHTVVPMNPSTQSPAMWKHATWRRNYSILAQGGGILTSHTGVLFLTTNLRARDLSRKTEGWLGMKENTSETGVPRAMRVHNSDPKTPCSGSGWTRRRLGPTMGQEGGRGWVFALPQ